MDACPNCLASIGNAEFNQRTEAGLIRLMVSGQRMVRPAKVERFRDGPSVSLARFGMQGSMVLTGRDYFIEAYVESPNNQAVIPMICTDVSGDLLFRLARYEAAPRSLVAFDAQETPLAIYQRSENALDWTMLVRDETSAPAARLKRSSSEQFDFDLVETGGPVVAGINVHDEETADWTDDVWSLHQVGQRLPFKLYGSIGIVLAAKYFFGRTEPIAAPKDPRSDAQFD